MEAFSSMPAKLESVGSISRLSKDSVLIFSVLWLLLGYAKIAIVDLLTIN